jgi:hypothetical protein
MRRAVSKWAAEEEAAQMLYGKLGVLLASVLWLDAQGAPQVGVSGPYSHEGLSILLVHHNAPTWTQGRIKASTLRYLTLEQALNQKKVVVHETSQVNELAVENNSADAVFIQVGDIVKGGNQDRMITNDFILPPHSGKLAIAAFCVEQGRWGQRGSEATQAFAGSTESASVRFEPKSMWNQMSVWSKVVELQAALASHLRKQDNATGLSGVRSVASPTSLMLTQTSPPVEEAVSAYTKVLAGAVQGKDDVVGYAFAVNGEWKGADLYASPELFASMWPKLLKSSVVEALQLGRQENAVPADTRRGMAFLTATGTGHETTTSVDRRIQLVKRETPDQLRTESRDGSAWVHRSIVTK